MGMTINDFVASRLLDRLKAMITVFDNYKKNVPANIDASLRQYGYLNQAELTGFIAQLKNAQQIFMANWGRNVPLPDRGGYVPNVDVMVDDIKQQLLPILSCTHLYAYFVSSIVASEVVGKAVSKYHLGADSKAALLKKDIFGQIALNNSSQKELHATTCVLSTEQQQAKSELNLLLVEYKKSLKGILNEKKVNSLRTVVPSETTNGAGDPQSVFSPDDFVVMSTNAQKIKERDKKTEEAAIRVAQGKERLAALAREAGWNAEREKIDERAQEVLQRTPDLQERETDEPKSKGKQRKNSDDSYVGRGSLGLGFQYGKALENKKEEDDTDGFGYLGQNKYSIAEQEANIPTAQSLMGDEDRIDEIERLLGKDNEDDKSGCGPGCCSIL